MADNIEGLKQMTLDLQRIIERRLVVEGNPHPSRVLCLELAREYMANFLKPGDTKAELLLGIDCELHRQRRMRNG